MLSISIIILYVIALEEAGDSKSAANLSQTYTGMYNIIIMLTISIQL